jgi:hypothetical protein
VAEFRKELNVLTLQPLPYKKEKPTKLAIERPAPGFRG